MTDNKTRGYITKCNLKYTNELSCGKTATILVSDRIGENEDSRFKHKNICESFSNCPYGERVPVEWMGEL